jgi:hypothetical protein
MEHGQVCKLQSFALKLLAIAVFMEHGHVCRLQSFAVIIENVPFLSKTILIREALIIAEEHARSISCSRTTRGPHTQPITAIESEAMIQAASSTKLQHLFAAKFLFTVNFVVLTHSSQFSVLSIFSLSLQLPLLPHALLRTQLTSQDLLLTRSAGDLLHSSTCLSPQRLIPYSYLLHSR